MMLMTSNSAATAYLLIMVTGILVLAVFLWYAMDKAFEHDKKVAINQAIIKDLMVKGFTKSEAREILSQMIAENKRQQIAITQQNLAYSDRVRALMNQGYSWYDANMMLNNQDAD